MPSIMACLDGYPIFLEWWWWWLEKMATTYLECTKLGGASSFFVPVAVLSFFGLSLSKRRLRETLCRKCCQYVRTYVRRYELHTYVQTYPFSFFRNSRPLFVLRTWRMKNSIMKSRAYVRTNIVRTRTYIREWKQLRRMKNSKIEPVPRTCKNLLNKLIFEFSFKYALFVLYEFV